MGAKREPKHHDLMDVARSIYGKMTLELETVSLHDVAAAVAATHHRANAGRVTPLDRHIKNYKKDSCLRSIHKRWRPIWF